MAKNFILFFLITIDFDFSAEAAETREEDEDLDVVDYMFMSIEQIMRERAVALALSGTLSASLRWPHPSLVILPLGNLR